jgi:tetratricopeptide (TPR) repeat protein
MKFFRFLLLITAFLAFMSCSHRSKAPERVSFTDEQQDQMNRDALLIASKRLEQMVIQAKGNKTSTSYLATDLFLKGNMSLLEGDFVTAAELFKHLIELVPEDEFVQKKYAISLIRVGDLEKSQLVLEKLYLKSHEEKVGLILAGVYTGVDKEDKARNLYQRILKSNPKSEDACVFLSKSYAMSKETKKAVGQLNTCAKNDPKNGMYDYYIGKLYIDQGQITKAMSSFQKAYSRQPELSPAVVALGILHEENEQHEKAIALYRKHLKKYPGDTSILNRIVQQLFLKEKYAEVIPYAEKLSDLEPENLNLKVKLGILYTDAKRYPEAVSVFKDLLITAPESDKILYYLGAIYQEMKEFQVSIEYFNQIPVSSGLYTDSSIQMANMLSALAQGESKWEEPFLSHVNKKIEEFDNMRVEFSVIKSGYFESVGNYKKAMETMMVVQDQKSFSTQHKYYLANLYEKEKRFQESTSLIMGILEKEPKNAHAWNFLGYALLERGEEDIDKAYEYIQTALKISPDDGYIRDSLGWYYYKKGDVKKALSELTAAFKKVPDDIEILKHLAEVHRELKNYSKAKDYLESALKNARYQADKHEILATIEELENDRLPASGALD